MFAWLTFVCLGLISTGFFSPLYAAEKYFSLWVASFETEKKASEQTAIFKKHQFDAFYSKENVEKLGARYRVYVGKYRSKAEIDMAVQTLETKKLLPKKYFVRTLPDPLARVADRKSDKTAAGISARGRDKVKESVPPGKTALAEENQPLAGRQPSVDPVRTTAAAALPVERLGEALPFRASYALSPVSQGEDKAASPSPQQMGTSPQISPQTDLTRHPLKDWSVTAAYGIWYMDMSKKLTNTGVNSRAFLHGPMFKASWRNLELELKYLTTIGDFSSTRDDHFLDGTSFAGRETFRRTDYDAALKYWFHAPSRKFSVAPVIGYKYTRLNDMSSAFTLATGQEFTLTGNMDIYGPTLGAELMIPFGNVDRPPVVLNLAATAMYLKAAGNHPNFLPATGARFNASVTGADFSTWGWGGSGDAHLIFRIADGLQLKVGGGLQSARLIDKAPDGVSDMWISNGFIASYAYLFYTW